MSIAPAFTPVPVRARRDGWTPDRQRAFIGALAESRNVAAAARAVGKSWQTAYRLRARADAAGFAAAWDAALAGPALDRPVTGRALGGVARPVTWRGRRIGEHRRFDERLAKFILRLRAPDRFGKDLHRAHAPGFADPIARLEAAIDAIAAPPGGNDGSGADYRGYVARASSPSTPDRPSRPRPATGASLAGRDRPGRLRRESG